MGKPHLSPSCIAECSLCLLRWPCTYSMLIQATFHVKESHIIIIMSVHLWMFYMYVWNMHRALILKRSKKSENHVLKNYFFTFLCYIVPVWQTCKWTSMITCTYFKGAFFFSSIVGTARICLMCNIFLCMELGEARPFVQYFNSLKHVCLWFFCFVFLFFAFFGCSKKCLTCQGKALIFSFC